MSQYLATLNFLYDLQRFGIKVGLENIKHLLSVLGNPEKRLRCIHIAGTNGKGSTAAMVASILTASGYKTGLYTSPHLVDFSERIRIDGKPISEKTIVEYTTILRPHIERRRATFFEATTAMAFQYFAENDVDVAVIETGLGGRWDATNVIDPLLSIITNIGLEHTEILGKTYRRIAFEKGGIIKRGVPCLTGATNSPALDVLRGIAKRRSSRFIEVPRRTSVEILDRSLDGSHFNLQGRGHGFENLFVGLAGDHQVRNAHLAITTVRELRSGGLDRISESSIRRGLRSVRVNSGLRGRLEILKKSPLVLADVAHNPDAVHTLAESLRSLVVGKVVTVFGVMRDKDLRGMLKVLSQFSRLIIGVHPNLPRALESNRIVHESHAMGIRAIDGGGVSRGIRRAQNESRIDEVILLTGSHYVLGDALKAAISTKGT